MGGSKVVPEIAAMTAEEQIDISTVLIGYSDWNKGVTPKDYAAKLTALINGLRTHHPEAVILLHVVSAKKYPVGCPGPTVVNQSAYVPTVGRVSPS